MNKAKTTNKKNEILDHYLQNESNNMTFYNPLSEFDNSDLRALSSVKAHGGDFSKFFKRMQDRMKR